MRAAIAEAQGGARAKPVAPIGRQLRAGQRDDRRTAEPDALDRAGNGEEREVLAEIIEARPYVRNSGASPERTVSSFDRGVRERVPPPSDPAADHDQFLPDVIRELRGRPPGAVQP